MAVDASDKGAWGIHYDGSTVLGLPGSGDCSNEKSDTNHAVLAVGWGEYTATDGKTIKYFIVKNSWGVDWVARATVPSGQVTKQDRLLRLEAAASSQTLQLCLVGMVCIQKLIALQLKQSAATRTTEQLQV